MDAPLSPSSPPSVYKKRIEPKFRWRHFGRFHIKDGISEILVREARQNAKYVLRDHRVPHIRDTSEDQPGGQKRESRKKNVFENIKRDGSKDLNTPGYKKADIRGRNKSLRFGTGCSFYH